MLSVVTDTLDVTTNNAIKSQEWECIISKRIGNDSAILKLNLSEARTLASMLGYILGDDKPRVSF